MKDERKTKKQLINELVELRRCIAGLKASEAERKRAEVSLTKEKSFTNSVINSLPGIFYLFDKNGRIHRWNQNVEIVTGYSAEEISKMNPLDFFVGEEERLVNEAIQEVFIKGQATVEAHVVSKGGRKTPYSFTGLRFISDNQNYIVGMGIDITKCKQAEAGLRRYSEHLEEMVEERTAELRIANEQLKQEINVRKRVEEALRVSHRFLEIANQQMEMIPMLNEFVAEVQNLTGCSAVGVRLLNEQGNIPYQAYKGFSQKFYELESPLSIKSDQCMCINVIKGVIDPKFPYYTKAGSFYMNNTTRFLATVSEEEKGQTRNACNQFGYESVALIPLRIGERILGLIHVADPQEKKVPLEMVEMLEKVAMQMDTAIQRVHAEEVLREGESKFRRLSQEFDALLNTISDNLCLTSPDLKILWANRHTASCLGKDISDLIGQYCYKLWRNRSIPCEPCPVQRSFLTGEPESDEVLTPDGKAWDMRTFPIKDEDGRVISVIEAGRDITERKQAEMALKKSTELYQKFIDSSSDDVALKDENFKLLIVNKSCKERMIKYGKGILGKTAFDLLPEETAKGCTKSDIKALESDSVIISEEQLGDRIFETRKFRVNLGDDKFGVGGYIRDITERKQIEEALRETNETLQSLIKASPLAIIILDSSGNVKLWNPAAENIFGWSEQEVLGKPHPIIPEDKQDEFHKYLNATLKGKTFCGDEIIRQKKDGLLIDLSLSTAVLRDAGGKAISILGIIADITERKREEEELKNSRKQLRNLYSHLQSVREEKRILLAREIHDELGQVLTAIKMEFGSLIDELSTEQKGIVQYTGSLYQLIDKALDSVQRICTELRPAMLDDLGLSAAIEWQAKEFEKWSDIKCEIIFEPEEIILDKEYSITLFRIFQEMLTNVARHAQATKVKIGLKEKQDKVILSIKDNGIGITKEKISNHKSLGLIGIRERINLLGGSFIIRGIQGKGTTTTVSIPIKTR